MPRGRSSPQAVCGLQYGGVARRAGISTKTLYRLIPNKAALFEAMVTERLDRFVIRFGSAPVKAATSTWPARSADCLRGARAQPGSHRAHSHGARRERQFPEIAQTFYTKAMRRTVATLANWLRAENERGLIALDDAELAASMLLGMFAFEPQRAACSVTRPRRAARNWSGARKPLPPCS